MEYKSRSHIEVCTCSRFSQANFEKNYRYPQIDGNADNDDNADSHEGLVCP